MPEIAKPIASKDESKKVKYPMNVKNIHTNTLCLENGMIKPGENGLATQSEISNFLNKYLELV